MTHSVYISPLKNAFVVACTNGYYGSVGQWCLKCPIGATCQGYIDLQLKPITPFADPVPIVGYFNLNGTMLSACPPAIALPGRTSCIVPCVPSDACTGENVCATGYMSKPPYFRCASCATGYFLQGPYCVQCPNSPIALIVGIACLFIGVALLGYFLNKRGVNIGYISIFVDWAQVR